MSILNDGVNAFMPGRDVTIVHGKDGPLSGLTFGVKDIFDVAGLPTGCGSAIKLADAEPAASTAPAIQKLLDAGAQFAGKTVTDELAFSMMGQNAHYPFPINSAAPDRVTGGSSCGSAAAVAAGLVDIATGSDTGGSIRAPASFCGLIGLRTTHGAISLAGTMPLSPSLDTFGWFARDIETYARVAEVLLPAAPAIDNWKPIHIDELDGLVLGHAEATEYARMVDVAANVLGKPQLAAPFKTKSQQRYWAFRKIQGYEAWASHGAWIGEADRDLGPGVKDRFEFGSSIEQTTYEAETAVRTEFRAELADLLGSNGVMLLPTVPGAAPLKDGSFDDLQAYRERAVELLCLSGLSGFPQITIPLGMAQGAPFGLSLLGPAGSDHALIALARQILDHKG